MKARDKALMLFVRARAMKKKASQKASKRKKEKRQTETTNLHQNGFPPSKAFLERLSGLDRSSCKKFENMTDYSQKGRFKDKGYRRIKVISLGDPNTGKSCLIKRFCESKFVSKYIKTIGVDFGVRPLKIEGRTVKVNFWDLSGNEAFEVIRKEFYANAQGFMLVFDVTNKMSFKNMEGWLKEARAEGMGRDTVGIVCGNKSDKKKRQVTEKEGRDWARAQGLLYFDTSAKSGLNVSLLFDSMFERVLERIERAK
jgi:DnaJ homolog subfamily C member 27